MVLPVFCSMLKAIVFALPTTTALLLVNHSRFTQ
jgi:hypothetical protein